MRNLIGIDGLRQRDLNNFVYSSRFHKLMNSFPHIVYRSIMSNSRLKDVY